MVDKRNWLDVLRIACDNTSQAKVATKLGVSPAVVNQCLKGTYKGRVDRIENLVRGVYMKLTVRCPVLGEISTRVCQDTQDQKFASTNPQRVAVYKACRNGCPFSRHGGE